MTTVLTGARIVTPTGVLDPGWVVLDGEQISAVGGGTPPTADLPSTPLHGAWLLPGFVDLHVHGGGGGSMIEGDAAQVEQAVTFHRKQGTAVTLASTITAPFDEMLRATAALADCADEGLIAGIHLEGPFLSPARAGAHKPQCMLPPDRSLLEQLIEAGRGHVRVITVAPELDGALDLIRAAVDAGVVAAIGHSNATYEEALAGIEAGARLATHLFNAMPPLLHRDPGATVACLNHPAVVCELICDGVHLRDAVVQLVFASVGAERVALITDAIPAAGLSDGTYRAGQYAIVVENGIATLPDRSSLAGSTLTMAGAVSHCLQAGLSITDVCRSAAQVPAKLLGINDRYGSIEVGKSADLVVFSEEFELEAVISRGLRLDA